MSVYYKYALDVEHLLQNINQEFQGFIDTLLI